MKNPRNNKSDPPRWWRSRDTGSFQPKTRPIFDDTVEDDRDEEFYEERVFRTSHKNDDQNWEEKEETSKTFASRFSYSDGVPPPTKEILYDLLRTLDVKDEKIKRLASLLSKSERDFSDLSEERDVLEDQVLQLRDIVKSLSEEPEPSFNKSYGREDREVTGQERDTWKRNERQYQDKIARYHQQIEHLQDRIREHVRREQLGRPTSTQQTNNNIVSALFVTRDAPKEVVEAVHKSLTKLYHPDTKNGSEDKMRAVNIAKDEIFKEQGW